ncbi:hypothetical protein Sta7437_0816 [Stanieria cyanosphaera PCC 7437]|uniref:Uncharacterized protein n=1 Tax=Stanieria cyanosphaera (strain ATCC 29371 / PCC 7437) TaxID=111780 RepID=K9XQN9_STAC7|nr:hypothetical protein [Stanieria cyanosphaera]AFZ34404.1 hypothetical protein Sta7437_0816 [Stanieria cyanosphaera PCC 7437]
MLIQFRHLYPDGSLISKLLTIDHGNYIVKVSVKVAGKTVATGLAAAQTVEMAEDRARERALATLVMEKSVLAKNNNQDLKESQKPQTDIKQQQIVEPVFIEQNLQVKETVEEVTSPTSQTSFSLETEASVQDTLNLVSPSINTSPQNNDYNSFDSVIEIQEQTTFEEDNETINFPIEESLPHSETISSSHSIPSLFDVNSTESTAEDELLEDNDFEQQTAPLSSGNNSEILEITFNEIIDQTDREMKRLGWTKEIGKEFLKAHYGKKSRLHLNDEELLAFLDYLQKLPTPQ